MAQGLAVAMLPVVVSGALAIHFFSASVREAIPLENDEVGYWSQIAAFREAGFNGGYFVMNERPSAMPFSRFGPHGPVFPAVYGLLARITGWRPYTAPIYGVVFLAAAATFWWFRTRPPRPVTASLLVASFWPLLLFVPTTMQEPLHFALAFLFAALLHPLLRDGAVSTPAAVILGGWLTLAALVRPTWALILVPVAALASFHASPRTRITALLAAVGAALAFYTVFAALAAPYPLGVGSSVVPAIGQGDLLGFARIVFRRAVPNLLAFVTPARDQPLQALLRFQFLLVMIVAAIRVRRSTAAAPADRFVLWLTGVTLAAVLLVGDVEGWRDYRLLGPVLLCSALVGCAHGTSWPAWVAAANIAASPLAVQTYVNLHRDRFFTDTTRIEYFRRDIGALVHYDPHVSGWGNTLLVHVDAYQNYLLGLPPGMGLATAMHWDQLALPIKSRFVLLRPVDYVGFPTRARLRPLGVTVAGTVYENLDWQRGHSH